jgi:hypothetical protein
MQRVKAREKVEWESLNEPCWMRTGSEDIWDAIMWAYKDYRDASADERRVLMRQRLGCIPQPRPLSDLLAQVMEAIETDEDDDSDERKIFFTFVPPKVQKTDLAASCSEYIRARPDVTTWDMVEKYIVETCSSLAETTRRARFDSREVSLCDIQPFIELFLRRVFSTLDHTPRVDYDHLNHVCRQAHIHVVVLSPSERILFDSLTWGNDAVRDLQRDVILVLSHPDGSYDSIGRYSYTKDGSKKICRLFSPDDDVIATLRHSQKKVSVSNHVEYIPEYVQHS